LTLVSIVVGIALVACLLYARVLDAFAFGDEAAASLGVNVGRARIVLFALTAMMTATIVSMVGSIGFVGLVVPHVARFLVGPLHVRLLPACAVVGAVFMVVADIASRTLIPQQVLPIGVVTALVGVPFFSIILYRFQRAS
jgi:iron complex transport system permease protein